MFPTGTQECIINIKAHYGKQIPFQTVLMFGPYDHKY